MIKYRFVDVPDDFNIENNFITDVITKNFADSVYSDTPEFVFFSYAGTEHYKFRECVKIFFSDKSIAPDFNQCDYAIGNLDIKFDERYCKAVCFTDSADEEQKKVAEDYIVSILNKGNVCYEKDALGLARQMSVPFISGRELITMLLKGRK